MHVTSQKHLNYGKRGLLPSRYDVLGSGGRVTRRSQAKVCQEYSFPQWLLDVLKRDPSCREDGWS